MITPIHLQEMFQSFSSEQRRAIITWQEKQLKTGCKLTFFLDKTKVFAQEKFEKSIQLVVDNTIAKTYVVMTEFVWKDV